MIILAGSSGPERTRKAKGKAKESNSSASTSASGGSSIRFSEDVVRAASGGRGRGGARGRSRGRGRGGSNVNGRDHAANSPPASPEITIVCVNNTRAQAGPSGAATLRERPERESPEVLSSFRQFPFVESSTSSGNANGPEASRSNDQLADSNIPLRRSFRNNSPRRNRTPDSDLPSHNPLRRRWNRTRSSNANSVVRNTAANDIRTRADTAANIRTRAAAAARARAAAATRTHAGARASSSATAGPSNRRTSTFGTRASSLNAFRKQRAQRLEARNYAKETRASEVKERSHARLAGSKVALNVARRKRDITKYEYFSMEAKVRSLEAEVEEAEMEKKRKGKELEEANAGVRLRRNEFSTRFIEEQDNLSECYAKYRTDLEDSSDIEMAANAHSDDVDDDDNNNFEDSELEERPLTDTFARLNPSDSSADDRIFRWITRDHSMVANAGSSGEASQDDCETEYESASDSNRNRRPRNRRPRSSRKD